MQIFMKYVWKSFSIYFTVQINVKKNKTHKGRVHQQTNKKLWDKYIYTHNEILFILKKKKILSLATAWMNLEDIVLSKVSQTQKEKNLIISLTCEI